MVKRRVLVLLLLAAVSFGLSAQTTIKYAFWGNPDAIGVEKDIIEAFEATHPDIKVTPVAVAYNDYHAKLQVLMAGGQAPDVMRIDSYFFQDFLKAGALKDITNLIKSAKIDLTKYYQSGLQDTIANGKNYGLPWSTAPIYMFLNTKLFADAGVPLPPTNWTWTDFVALTAKLSKGSGDTQQWGMGLAAVELNSILPFLWGAGEDLFNADRTKFALTTPGAVAKLNEVAGLIKKGQIADPSVFPSADVLTKYFAQGRIAMRIGAASDILSTQKIDGVDFVVYPFPGTAKYPRATISKANVVGLSSTTKNEKAAWEFLQFLRAPGQQGEVLYMQAKRMPPTVNDLALWALYADTSKPPKNVAAVTAEINQKYGHLLPLRSGWLEVQGIVMPQVQKIYSGTVDAATAMGEIAERVQTVLDRK
jgi:multiple sugar transport system substrate-binding protein